MLYTKTRYIKRNKEGGLMDLNLNRGSRPAPMPGRPSSEPSAHHASADTNVKKKVVKGMKGQKAFNLVMLFGVSVLALFLIVYMAFWGGAKNYVKKDQYQAVFLNGGQVYFGKLSNTDKRFWKLSDIYYLRVNQQIQPNQSSSASTNSSASDVTLAKLGCELHGPEDSMQIHRDQVQFWENLKDDGQVVTAIKKFMTDNPQGLKCTNTAASGQQSTATPTASAAATATPKTTATPKP